MLLRDELVDLPGERSRVTIQMARPGDTDTDPVRFAAVAEGVKALIAATTGNLETLLEDVARERASDPAEPPKPVSRSRFLTSPIVGLGAGPAPPPV
jgi:hypothetical protein